MVSICKLGFRFLQNKEKGKEKEKGKRRSRRRKGLDPLSGQTKDCLSPMSYKECLSVSLTVMIVMTEMEFSSEIYHEFVINVG